MPRCVEKRFAENRTFSSAAPPNRRATQQSGYKKSAAISDLFGTARPRPAVKPLTVFRAELVGSEETSWEALFAGYTALKAITFSSSVEMLLE